MFSFISHHGISIYTKLSGYVCVDRHSIEAKVKYSLLLLTRKHVIKYLYSTVKPMQNMSDYYVTGSTVYSTVLIFPYVVLLSFGITRTVP